MTQLTHKQQQLFNALSIVVGNAMYALTVVLFLMPSGLITGGATGIALAFNKVTGLPVSAVLFVVNVVMLLLGWWVLGSRFALNTMASTVLSPFFMALWERLLGDLVLTDDLVLNTVFAGFGIGISLGITIRAGASTGGMDIPPLVLQKWFRWPVSITMMLFDIAILLVQAAFSQPEQVLYGIVLVIVYTVVLDKVRSTQNAGALFRTGDAFAVEQIFCAASPPLRSAVTSTKRLWGQDDRCCGAVCPRREGVRFPQRERTVLIRHAVKQKAAPEGGQLFFVVYGFYRRITISSVSVV